MHTQEALADEENQRRIFAISAWKEPRLFKEKERVLLQLTEEVTFIWNDGVNDDTYNKAFKNFWRKNFGTNNYDNSSH